MSTHGCQYLIVLRGWVQGCWAACDNVKLISSLIIQLLMAAYRTGAPTDVFWSPQIGDFKDAMNVDKIIAWYMQSKKSSRWFCVVLFSFGPCAMQKFHEPVLLLMSFHDRWGKQGTRKINRDFWILYSILQLPYNYGVWALSILNAKSCYWLWRSAIYLVIVLCWSWLNVANKWINELLWLLAFKSQTSMYKAL